MCTSVLCVYNLRNTDAKLVGKLNWGWLNILQFQNMQKLDCTLSDANVLTQPNLRLSESDSAALDLIGPKTTV